jgi:hypothetical protein
LATLLRRDGHDVVIPASVGTSGESDPAQLTRAIADRRILLSGNHEDFEELHDLILASTGHHPGIFVVRKDNDARRDLKVPGIVRAVGRLAGAEIPLQDTLFVLNHWW